jgi:hypothetical protein
VLERAGAGIDLGDRVPVCVRDEDIVACRRDDRRAVELVLGDEALSAVVANVRAAGACPAAGA